jgi:hypothetical protein
MLNTFLDKVVFADDVCRVLRQTFHQSPRILRAILSSPKPTMHSTLSVCKKSVFFVRDMCVPACKNLTIVQNPENVQNVQNVCTEVPLAGGSILGSKLVRIKGLAEASESLRIDQKTLRNN